MSKESPFSINRWLEQDTKGWIFVTNCQMVKDTIRPILSLFIDLLGRKLLSMSDDFDRRVYFFLDEFGTLQRLSSIVNLLTTSRSKSGSVWIGIQDIGQIDKLYTSSLRQSIINACGTSVLLAVAESDTARILSEKIGEREQLKIQHSVSGGPSESRDGFTYSGNEKLDKLIVPAELLNLKKLEGFVKIPNYSITKGSLKHKNRKLRADPLIVRPDLC